MKQDSTDIRIQAWESEDGKHAAASMSLGSGGGTKTGAGGKPQPYGWHGYYGETGGGASSGPVYRGKVSLPHEVRGKVTPPVQKGKDTPPPPPLNQGGRVGVSTKNDESGKKNPNPEALHAKTREQVQNVLDKSPSAQDVNMNSGYRSGDKGPHGEGRAVDINRVNGQKVSDAIDPSVTTEQREKMRARLEEIKAAAEANKEVEAYIDPLDGYFRPAEPNSKSPGRKSKFEEIYDHRHHIHITIRK
jgi:hypothetical protein